MMQRTQAPYICRLSDKIMRLYICICILFFSCVVQAQDINIIPNPIKVKVIKEEKPFTINERTKIVLGPMGENLNSFSDYLNNYLLKFYGQKLEVVDWENKPDKNYITISLSPSHRTHTNEYSINVTSFSIDINSDDNEGVFYGLQTLTQLLPANKTTKSLNATIPSLQITDYPRFAYRGLHLDCARHFWSVEFLKKYIDYLALHKFNTFHWHLTDDQGWRIEIKKYPKLTSVGGWRNGTIIGRYPGTGNDRIKYGGFYTQHQIKEIVKYAADRYIAVIPEIEMPGHASAAIAAYPELSCFPDKSTDYPKECAWSGPTAGKQVQQTWGVFDDVFCAGKENTFKFLEDVMEEVLALFPSKYIHVGGDECPKEHWKKCPACQQRMKDNKLKDEHELQSYFIQRMEKHLNAKGRTLIGWDEILEGGLAPNAVVMSWRGEQGGIEAAKQNHYVIMTPGNPVYFDHTQSENEDSVTIGGYNPIEKVYAYEPVPKELNDEQAKYILGAQANMWTEYMKNTSKVEYMIFPRMAALSEVLWSPKEKKDWKGFEKRLKEQFKRYDLWKANYSMSYFDLKFSILPTESNNGIIWKIEKKSNGEILVAEEAFPKTNEIAHEYNLKGEHVNKSCTMIASFHPEVNDYTIVHFKQKFSFNKATGKKITLSTPASDKYPGDGAFTLVNGVINEKGLARSKEFLGFSGADCEAIIDLGKEEVIKSVTINFLDQRSSWIYPPGIIDIYMSNDGVNFKESPNEERGKEIPGEISRNMNATFYPAANARYIKVVARNFGIIPDGKPGAGNKAWLFVDEIEVK